MEVKSIWTNAKDTVPRLGTAEKDTGIRVDHKLKRAL